jgi:hypothetical protein
VPLARLRWLVVSGGLFSAILAKRLPAVPGRILKCT